MRTFVLAASALAGCAGLACAQTELYISEYQFQNARMAAMNLDGSNARALFSLPPADWLPLGITYSPAAQRLIWMDSAGGSELRSNNIAGTTPALIAAVPGFCRGASLDAAGRIFFSSGNTLRRVNADGTGMVTLFTASTSNPLGSPRVDATNGHIYFGADGEIKRSNLDGGNLKTIVRGISQPRAVALDLASGYIYWLDADTHSDYLGRAKLDDSDFRVLHDISPNIVQSPGLIDMLVDPASGFVFVQDELSGLLTRVGLNGGSPTVIYTNPTGLSHSGITLSTGEPAQPLRDCNNNGLHDDIDIANGAPDCDNNGMIDTCQAQACPQHTFLLDQGSNAASTTGRAVGVPSQWQVFQQFDVPAGGWTIAQIAIDGYTSNYADGSGLTLTLFPDNAATGLPDETTPLASTTAHLRFNTNNVNWVYSPLAVMLDAGRYWVRIEANNPTVYGASINQGFSGLPSRSRGSSGSFTGPASPIALRLIQGSVCYANCDHSTTPPILNVADFGCFLGKFAAADPYANCDGSTQEPVLNVADFSCFLSKFAAGCP